MSHTTVSEFVRYGTVGRSGVEAMEASTDRSFPRHTHDHFGIGLVTSGRHTSWSGRGQVEAGAGEFICVNPGEVHDGRPVGGRRRTWRILYFEPQVLAALHADVRENSAAQFEFTAPVFSQPDLYAAFNSAFSLAAVDASQRTALESETRLLALIGRLTLKSRRRSGVHTPRGMQIRNAKQLIDDAPTSPWSLADLAAAAGVTRFQLIRGFARELGLTPHAYLLQRRLEIAKGLLRSRRGIAEIAAHAGFSDQSHLTRAFARQYGITPSRYRQHVG